MSDDSLEESTPTFRRPTEQERQKADPHADQAAYFAYWTMKHHERELERRRGRSGLSIYEQARSRYRY